MYKITLIFPRNREQLEKKYAVALANAVSDILTVEELSYVISELGRKDIVKNGDC